MKIRPLRRYSVDDFGKDAPSWLPGFLDNLNLQVDTLNAVLQNNVDLDNNTLGERQTVSVTHNVPITIKLRTLAQQPYFVRAGYASGHIVTGCAITNYNTDGTIQITVTFSDAPTAAVSTVLYFEP